MNLSGRPLTSLSLPPATRLLSGPGSGPLEFTHPRYCVTLPEDTHVAALVANVTALHNTGAGVRYSITGGNRDGLFTIQKHNGLITLAAALDYETHAHHELVVAAEASGVLVHALVLVRVLDVNDNPPYFVTSDLKATVIEEDDRDLPLPLAKVEAHDRDLVDQGRLHYSVAGDGVDGFAANDVFFAVDATTGQLLQVRRRVEKRVEVKGRNEQGRGNQREAKR
ncbi:putative neural-cadherin [Penaeus vannamei]|uniref:Putative neural-cadherin n=1 Tax=Penaeus vannamei TaxID=6689 RepID=A0A3R7MQB9_PENVA|nr:putative neural-cadherin [Penaeus vannamei]